MRHGEKKLFRRGIALFLSLSLALGCAGCGGTGSTDSTGMSASAATMFLRKMEGAVTVSDAEGKSIEPAENLGLYSGYGMGTEAESFAWIDLDKVKLAKLDEYSEAAISKDGKNLSIEIQSGSLFFNVTEPLADDETMEIRTSSMMVGIRGTCGWVTENTAALLEGTVTVTAEGQSATVSAGEMAILTDEGTLEVKPFTTSSVPAFVAVELEDDEVLAEEVKDDAGIDVLDPVDPICLRDMYTYSRSLTYNADGELCAEGEYFADEQGRIARNIGKPVGEYVATNDTVTTYEYNDEGTLQTQIIDRVSNNGDLVYYEVTEDTADHRTMVNISDEDCRREVIYYYDAQGRITRSEDVVDGQLLWEDTYTYDGDGKLIRSDRSSGHYVLYEYD